MTLEMDATFIHPTLKGMLELAILNTFIQSTRHEKMGVPSSYS